MNNDMDLLIESQKALAAVLDDEVCSPERALQLSAIEIKLRERLSPPIVAKRLARAL